MSIRKKLFRLRYPNLQIVCGGSGGNPNLLHFLHLLCHTLFFLFFLFLIAEFVEADDAGNRRFGGRGDFDQIKAFFGSQSERFLSRHDADIFTCLPNQAQFRGANLIIYSVLLDGAIITMRSKNVKR